MIRIIFVLLALASSAVLFADVGSQWPNAREIAKAPAWPKAFAGDPTRCKKIDAEAFFSKVNNPSNAVEDRYVIDAQVDLNVDGVCEVFAHRPTDCGKLCTSEGFELRAGTFVSIGDVTLGEFLEPFNGWLQIKSSSYTGAYYYYFLLRFQGGAYKNYRRDEFKEDEKEQITKYIHTLVGQDLEESGKGH